MSAARQVISDGGDGKTPMTVRQPKPPQVDMGGLSNIRGITAVAKRWPPETASPLSSPRLQNRKLPGEMPESSASTSLRQKHLILQTTRWKILQEQLVSQKAKELANAIKHLQRKCAVLESEERAAADAGGAHLLEAAALFRERERVQHTIKGLQAEAAKLKLADEARLAACERQQRAVEQLERDYISLRDHGRYEEAYELDKQLPDLKQRISSLWIELTGSTPELLVERASKGDTETGQIAGRRPVTVPNPPSMADHRAVVTASLEKAQRKIERLRSDDTVPDYVVEREAEKLVALEVVLNQKFRPKQRKQPAPPSALGFGASIHRRQIRIVNLRVPRAVLSKSVLFGV
jgi:hypothetical protein